MALIIEALSAQPWLVVAMAAGLAVWAGALWTIVKSPRFLRKWLWVLLTFATFSITWPAGPGVTIGIGIPLGAAYVLWFARYGKAPTEEAIARRRSMTNAPTPDASKVRTLRIAYGVLIAATLGMAVWAACGGLPLLNGHGASPDMMRRAQISAAMSFAAVMCLFGFLIVRPYWWGKLVCWFAAFAWIGNGLISIFISQAKLLGSMPSGYGVVPLAAGGVALAVGVLHQRVDPRYGGSYLRLHESNRAS